MELGDKIIDYVLGELHDEEEFERLILQSEEVWAKVEKTSKIYDTLRKAAVKYKAIKEHFIEFVVIKDDYEYIGSFEFKDGQLITDSVKLKGPGRYRVMNEWLGTLWEVNVPDEYCIQHAAGEPLLAKAAFDDLGEIAKKHIEIDEIGQKFSVNLKQGQLILSKV